jgi:ribosomal protein L19E
MSKNSVINAKAVQHHSDSRWHVTVINHRGKTLLGVGVRSGAAAKRLVKELRSARWLVTG